MTREELRNGAVVCHVKHNRKYRIVSCNMRYKDSVNGWTDAVTYTPLYDNDYEMFTRELQSFLDEFELKK